METKSNKPIKPSGKTGVSLTELIVAITVISIVCIATATAIAVFRQMSYTNGIKERCAVAINSIADNILADLDKNGLQKSEYYESFANDYLASVDLREVIPSTDNSDNSSWKGANCKVEISRNSMASSVSKDFAIYTMLITLDNGQKGKFGITVRQCLYIPEKYDIPNNYSNGDSN